MNYEHAAAAWANHLNMPFGTNARECDLDLQLMIALFRGIDRETIEQIQVDPCAFAARVAAYRHNFALRHQPEL